MRNQVYVILFLLLIVASCGKEVKIEETGIIADNTYSELVKVDGHEFDSLIIENCVFKKRGLSLGNVDHVIIRNCTFQDINGNGIKVGFIGPCENITIENCTFKNIGYNGVDSHKEALNCTIRGCSFENMALSETGAAMAQPHHAIYWKGKNVLIEENFFKAGTQPYGNAISVRSSGIVRKNTIMDAPKNGIMYYSNHPGGDSLIIENNFLINNTYSITCATLGNLDWHNKNVIIRFNSMIQKDNYSFYVAQDFESTTNIEIYGNAVVNPTEEYLKSFYDVTGFMNNLLRPEDIGFVNPETGDLHLTGASEAEGFCAGLEHYPLTDIDGDLRDSETLNAGADE